MVRPVDTTACQSVNHTTRHVRDDDERVGDDLAVDRRR